MEEKYFNQTTKQYTLKEKVSNWFYYNKLWLLVGIIILYIASTILWNILGIGQVKPDYQIAYVGSKQPPTDCILNLEKKLATFGEDINKDGIVSVKISLHIDSNDASLENMMYNYASEVSILADISEGESYFFLLEDPSAFQLNYQILAHLDGSIPSNDDFNAMDKVYSWEQCPILTALEFETEEKTIEYQNFLSSLYLGRRYFYNDTTISSDTIKQNEAFWNIITMNTLS